MTNGYLFVGKYYMAKLVTPAAIEARKREVLGRLYDKEYEYHNTRDAEVRRKKNGFYEDTRKRIA